ncbi:MAG: tetratricopeptide repeat protein [candidate division Zixibacteria bacterium]|nr:tetratricopeptide repeat protein [candidate division Zixibacteria bacterium]
MIKKSTLGLLLVVLAVGQNVTSQEATENSDIVVGKTHTIESKILSEERTISVFLPIGYQDNDFRYPVAYALDGHFVPRLMNVTSAMEHLDGQGMVPQIIIIGIDTPNSIRDYFPTELEGRPGSGQADNFIKFISDELKPWVDSTYRTEPFNILCGASNSGLLTVYTYLTKPDIFSAYLAASPSIGWCKEFILEKIADRFSQENQSMPSLYMNYATDDIESIVLSAMPDFVSSLEKNIPEHLRWEMEILEDVGHVPFVSFYNGLEFIFSGWKYPEDSVKANGLDGLCAHSKYLEDKYGFPVRIPSGDLMDLGADYFRGENWQKAIDVFRVYTTEYPNSERPVYILAETFRRNEDIDSAIVYFEKTLEINPDHTRAQQKLEAINSSSD